MIAQPTSIPATPNPASLEQEVTLLRATLADALGRIENLEQRVGMSTATGSLADSASDKVTATQSTHRPLIPLDSPAMTTALSLCAEVFPNCRTKVEAVTDPDDPERSWRLITVYWQSSVREAIDRQSLWHNRFDAIHPEAIHDISLFVVPE